MTEEFEDDDMMQETWPSPLRVFQRLYHDNVSRDATNEAFRAGSPLIAVEFEALQAGESFNLGGLHKSYTRGPNGVEVASYHELPSSIRPAVAHLAVCLSSDVWFLRRLSRQIRLMEWPTPSSVDAEDLHTNLTVMVFADFIHVFARHSENIFTAVKMAGDDHFNPDLYAFTMIEDPGSNHACLKKSHAIQPIFREMHNHLQIDLDEDWVWDVSPPEVHKFTKKSEPDEVDIAQNYKAPNAQGRILAP